jgi:hypothetical protein
VCNFTPQAPLISRTNAAAIEIENRLPGCEEGIQVAVAKKIARIDKDRPMFAVQGVPGPK